VGAPTVHLGQVDCSRSHVVGHRDDVEVAFFTPSRVTHQSAEYYQLRVTFPVTDDLLDHQAEKIADALHESDPRDGAEIIGGTAPDVHLRIGSRFRPPQ
jgi:hypothetical protein